MVFNALIRTHHITSRKKISTLKKAADTLNCSVLLRTGGTPGVMYVEGHSVDDVSAWVSSVQRLRYKDYQLLAKPGPGADGAATRTTVTPGLREVESIKEFGAVMQELGIWEWWRRAMGYLRSD